MAASGGADGGSARGPTFSLRSPAGGKRKEPDWGELHKELHKKGVTRKLLWLEHAEVQTETYSYPQFCARYSRWAKAVHPTMRLAHKAGEKLSVDYAGLPMFYQDRTTGEAHEVSVFVATLGASSGTFIEDIFLNHVAMKAGVRQS